MPSLAYIFAGSGVVFDISSVTNPSHSGSNGVTFVIMPHRAYVDAYGHDIARYPEIFHAFSQRKGIWRNDADIAFKIHKGLAVEILRVNDGVIYVCKYLEFI